MNDRMDPERERISRDPKQPSSLIVDVAAFNRSRLPKPHRFNRPCGAKELLFAETAAPPHLRSLEPQGDL